MDFRHRTLANGLTVIAEPNEAAHTAAVGFFVKAGARDEDAPLMGVSHFLEHMMFKGTQRRSADDVNRQFDELGADYNAFTSHEMTVYYAAVLPEFMPAVVELWTDMLRPALRGDDFAMEKNVILEEIGMYDDRPSWRLQDMLMEHYFAQHPLGFRVLGTKDTVSALSAEQMRDYFASRYAPDNMIVAAAGRLDFDWLCGELADQTAAWTPRQLQRNHGTPTAHAGEHRAGDPKLTRHYLGLMCPAPSAQDERRYAAKVLADALGDDEGSRLFWALIDPGLADEADFSFVAMDGTGAYMAFATCDPDRATQVETILTDTIEQFATAIDDDELERVKNKLATAVTLQSESPAGRMRGLGQQWTYLGQYTPLEEELARITAVTKADLIALCRDFPFTPRTTLRLGPG
jgi:predicted Zn-dependent peptidase